jgi:predicted methyltransferase
MRLQTFVAVFLLLSGSALAADHAAVADKALQAAVAGAQRSPKLAARDRYRHPVEELAFFGIRPNMTVVEIWPGEGYWTEILAPYLHDRGVYYTATFETDWGDSLNAPAPPVAGSMSNLDLEKHMEERNREFHAKLDADPSVYGKVRVTTFGNGHYDIAPAGSADLVVSFRNIHNWMAPLPFADAAFVAFFKALKPGGILGIEEHRGRTDRPQDPEAVSGYVREDYTIRLAEKAGFRLVGSSEINANPKDTKDWPAGVWTLPPSLILGDKDRDKYLSIGEGDNFVLKFQKPPAQ